MPRTFANLNARIVKAKSKIKSRKFNAVGLRFRASQKAAQPYDISPWPGGGEPTGLADGPSGASWRRHDRGCSPSHDCRAGRRQEELRQKAQRTHKEVASPGTRRDRGARASVSPQRHAQPAPSRARGAIGDARPRKTLAALGQNMALLTASHRAVKVLRSIEFMFLPHGLASCPFVMSRHVPWRSRANSFSPA